MKRIVIYAVTFNSYPELAAFLKSVDRAADFAAEEAEVEVCVADNTVEQPEKIVVENRHAVVRVFPYRENLGYMGAVQRMMGEQDPRSYDYVIISNVDLIFEEDALLELVRLQVRQDTGWIAPSLFSTCLGFDRNPSVLHRYPVWKLRMLAVMFRFPILDYLYRLTFYRRKGMRPAVKKPLEIYAGHGSVMILTRAYFEHCGLPEYPLFLFCEEVYLAEMCREHQLKVVYWPSVRILDEEHVSIAKMHRADFYRYNYEAVRFILRRFYAF